ncbi:MAG TPA: TetR family transcriptional regulator, partial [Actinomycetes bacterium]|nr:TetR family transcriptional regulator [Actinomycetes bacterium]
MARSARAEEVVAAARRLLEEEGAAALTMRRLAERLGIQAPSAVQAPARQDRARGGHHRHRHGGGGGLVRGGHRRGDRTPPGP